tara:strand:- start:4764 stop:6047 length:1284 start_codon:yes stop_codon:yes gene_type:complete
MDKVMNSYNLVENKTLEINLSNDEAEALKALESKIASFVSGLPDDSFEDEDRRFKITFQKSQIQENTYFLTVSNAIGQIVLGDHIFNISPKIQDDHFIEIYKLDKNKDKNLWIEDNQGTAAKGEIFYLIINDFLNGVEKVVSKGIRKGYKQFEDELKYIKGRVNVMETTRNLLSGKLAIKTEYEEFSIDTALNRLIKSALFEIKTLHSSESLHVTSSDFIETLVSKASKLYNHFEFIPDYLASDLRVNVDRNTKYYEQALVGAKNILQSYGAEVTVGDITASARMMNTFMVIENGLRYFLNQNLPEKFMCNSKPTSKNSRDGKYSFNPDLVFGTIAENIATGDIKYKYWTSQNKFSRGDLQQSITFTNAYKVQKGIIIGFSDSSFNPSKYHDKIGDIDFFVSTWDTGKDPSKASQKLLEQITDILKS